MVIQPIQNTSPSTSSSQNTASQTESTLAIINKVVFISGLGKSHTTETPIRLLENV